MKLHKKNLSIKLLSLSVLLLLFSCGGLDKPTQSPNPLDKVESAVKAEPPISEYIRNIHQDSKGDFWLGTNGSGVAHFDGQQVSYYTIGQTFGGHQVNGIAEDQENNLWFATDLGVVKYDWSINNLNEQVTPVFENQQEIGGQYFWSVFVDSNNDIWAGCSKKIYRCVQGVWIPFELPYPEKVDGEFISKATAWSITEDSKGNMWFSTNGFGVYKYDGKNFVQITKEDGLAGNNVDAIIEDQQGNMWFGTRFNGVSRYDGKAFTNFSFPDDIGNNEVCEVFEDKQGKIWFSSEGYGVYCFDGEKLKNYSEAQGLMVKAVQTIFQDQKARIWAGGGGGLYRLEGDSFIHVSNNGPWE